MRHISIFLLFLFSIQLLFAQREKEEDIHLESPYHTISNHLQHLEPNNFHPEIAIKSFPTVPYSKKELEELAIQLRQIFNGEGYYVSLRKVPIDTGYVDSSTNKRKYILFARYPDIYVEKKGKKWLYSLKTLQEIPNIHAQVYPWGTDKLLNMMPQKSENSFLGVKLWQYVGLVILIVGAWLLFVLLNFILSFLIRRVGKLDSKFVERAELMPVIRPFSLFFVAILLKYLFPILQLSIVVNYLLRMMLRVAIPTFGVITLYYVIEVFGAVGNRFANKTQNTLDNQLVPLIQKVLRITIVVFGIIFIFQNIGVNVTALIAGVSIGGLAFALAAQDTVKNFLGSVTILLDAPFQIGDYIEFDGKSGYVEEVGLRSTRLRTLEGTTISVPNTKIADAAVNNIGRRVLRSFSPKLFVSAHTPFENVEEFVRELKEFAAEFPLGLKEQNKVYLYNLNGRSLQVLLEIHFDALVVKEAEVRAQTLEKILTLSQKHKIRFV